MRIFYRDWVTNAMERLGMTEGQRIESPMVTRAIARAQKKVEDRNFEIRKSLLEYDEVMDSQRKTIYGTRQEVLEGVDLREKFRRGYRRQALPGAGGGLRREPDISAGYSLRVRPTAFRDKLSCPHLRLRVAQYCRNRRHRCHRRRR